MITIHWWELALYCSFWAVAGVVLGTITTHRVWKKQFEEFNEWRRGHKL